MIRIDFDRVKHRYRLNGQPVLGVTDVLKNTGVADYSGYPEESRDYYMARGKAVHKAAELLMTNRFDWSYLDEAPDWAGYIIAVDRLLQSGRIEPLLVEVPVASVEFGYCGTLDFLCRIDGALGLPDFKCTKAHRSTAIQTAAYKAALPSLADLVVVIDGAEKTVTYEHANEDHARFGIELHKNGTPKVIEYNDFDDSQLWFSALAIAKWQAEGRRYREDEQ